MVVFYCRVKIFLTSTNLVNDMTWSFILNLLSTIGSTNIKLLDCRRLIIWPLPRIVLPSATSPKWSTTRAFCSDARWLSGRKTMDSKNLPEYPAITKKQTTLTNQFMKEESLVPAVQFVTKTIFMVCALLETFWPSETLWNNKQVE